MKLTPQLLKDIYDASKAWGLVVIAVSFVVGFFAGVERGALVGVGAGVALFLIWILSQLLKVRWTQAQAAIALLEDERHKDEEAYRTAAVSLRAAHRDALIGMIAFPIIAISAIALLVQPPVWHWWTTDKPKSLHWEDFHYYHPTVGQSKWYDVPFIEGLIIHLKDEGIASNKPSRIAVGTTAPFNHPTRVFSCALKIENGKYESAGYAFRLQGEIDERTYEPIRTEHPDPQTMLLRVPACEKGDRIFFVVRISPLGISKDFPEDVSHVSILTLVDEEQ
jgi:hypothetical protein